MKKNVLYGVGILAVIVVVGVGLYWASHSSPTNSFPPAGPPVIVGTITAVNTDSITVEALNPLLPALPLSNGTTSVTVPVSMVAHTSSDSIAIQGVTTFRKQIPVDSAKAAADVAKNAIALANNKPGTPPPVTSTFQTITVSDLAVGQQVSVTLTTAGIHNGQGTAADIILLPAVPQQASSTLPVLPPMPPKVAH